MKVREQNNTGWMKIVGKGVDEYLEEVIPPFSKTSFEAELLSFLKDQGAPPVDLETRAALFDIAVDFYRSRTAADAMKKGGILQDWKARKRLIRSLLRDLEGVKRRAQQATGPQNGPLTNLVAESTMKKTNAVSQQPPRF